MALSKSNTFIFAINYPSLSVFSLVSLLLKLKVKNTVMPSTNTVAMLITMSRLITDNIITIPKILTKNILRNNNDDNPNAKSFSETKVVI